jgi:hypothetical protein
VALNQLLGTYAGIQFALNISTLYQRRLGPGEPVMRAIFALVLIMGMGSAISAEDPIFLTENAADYLAELTRITDGLTIEESIASIDQYVAHLDEFAPESNLEVLLPDLELKDTAFSESYSLNCSQFVRIYNHYTDNFKKTHFSIGSSDDVDSAVSGLEVHIPIDTKLSRFSTGCRELKGRVEEYGKKKEQILLGETDVEAQTATEKVADKDEVLSSDSFQSFYEKIEQRINNEEVKGVGLLALAGLEELTAEMVSKAFEVKNKDYFGGILDKHTLNFEDISKKFGLYCDNLDQYYDLYYEKFREANFSEEELEEFSRHAKITGMLQTYKENCLISGIAITKYLDKINELDSKYFDLLFMYTEALLKDVASRMDEEVNDAKNTLEAADKALTLAEEEALEAAKKVLILIDTIIDSDGGSVTE